MVGSMGCTTERIGKYFCGGLFLKKDKVGFEKVATNHPSTCKSSYPEWECWRNRIVDKIGGNWWSFFNESYCDPSSPSDSCAWRVDSIASVNHNTCLQGAVYTAIEAYPPASSCFANCTEGTILPVRNTSDPCWIGCAFDAVLGETGGYSNGTVAGMPLADLVSAWEGAFSPGGCPQMGNGSSSGL
jgi:hypothetical protein